MTTDGTNAAPAPAAADAPDLSHISPRDKAEILAQALPYIRKFHGKTIVIKYGGNAMTDPALQQDFAEDVVLLKLVGMNPVVVHGGGPQIEEALAKIGKKGSFIQGMRVTDDETMEVVEWVLAGQVQQDIVGLINVAGGKAVGLTGRDGGLIRARKLKMVDLKDPTKLLDVGNVGEIESIDPAVVKALQDDQFIPVISPLGFGADNENYNINADVVAGKLAEVLKAEKLMMLTNTPGVLDKAGKLLTNLSAREIDELFADGISRGVGVLGKFDAADRHQRGQVEHGDRTVLVGDVAAAQRGDKQARAGAVGHRHPAQQTLTAGIVNPQTRIAPRDEQPAACRIVG